MGLELGFVGYIYGALVGIGEWAVWATETRWARKKMEVFGWTCKR
jgi:hypothetical protein